MSTRARMGELAGMLLETHERAGTARPPLPGKPKTIKKKIVSPVIGKTSIRQSAPAPAQAPASPVHRAHGQRGDFEKVTVTLPAEVRVMLLEESLRRKKERSPDWPIAAVVREAIAAYLGPKP